MKIYEEVAEQQSTVVLVLDFKEGKTCLAMLEEAIKAQPKKTSWRKLYKMFNEMPVFTTKDK